MVSIEHTYLDIDEIYAERLQKPQKQMRTAIAECISGSETAGGTFITRGWAARQFAAECIVLPGRVMVVDRNAAEYLFSADLYNFGKLCTQRWLNQYDGNLPRLAPESRVMTLNIKTRDRDGKPHPFLYAGELFGLSYNHFLAQGTDVAAILGSWGQQLGKRTNYDQFITELQRLRTDSSADSDDQLSQAAFTTWTGRQAQKLGFSHATVLAIRKEKLQSNFSLNHIVVFFQKA